MGQPLVGRASPAPGLTIADTPRAAAGVLARSVVGCRIESSTLVRLMGPTTKPRNSEAFGNR